MECSGADLSKAHVVYYLSKSGKMEPPHMMEVPHSSHAGLRLKDVKQRLTVLRGSALPNMFSWAYKRSYKNKYIWLDLSEEDVIVPGRDGEYVLKGSELIDDFQDKMMKHSSNLDAVNNKQTEVHQSRYLGAEIWLNKEKAKANLHEPALMLTYPQHDAYVKYSNFSQDTLGTGVQVRSKRKTIDSFIHRNNLEAGVSTGSDESQLDNKISSSSDLSDSSSKKSNDVGVYKRSSPVLARRSCCSDAATQTEEKEWLVAVGIRDHACRTLKQNGHNAFSNQWKVFDQKHVHDPSQAEASLLSMISGELASEKNLTSQNKSENDHSDQSQDKHSTKLKHTSASRVIYQSQDKHSTKLKHTSASRVIYQILSCGGIDTKSQNVLSENDEKPAISKKRSPRRQLSRLLQGPSPPSSRGGSKSVTPKSNRSPESLSSRMGTPLAHSCELSLENIEHHDISNLSIPPSSEIGLVTALPSPSYDIELSKSNGRCSSFSSRVSASRSQEFKDTRTTFDTLCKTPKGSPIHEDYRTMTNASKAVSPIQLFSAQKDTNREGWTSQSQRVYPSQAANFLNCTENFQQLRLRSNWKDLSPVREKSQLGQINNRENDRVIKQETWTKDLLLQKNTIYSSSEGGFTLPI
ncbi:hypothetical protein O6H91_20G008100 [Diphasiastrum complanatum]|uniref:Uncharacterized protein n=2 Tax=Diphasiastrum complanatum TaxID=34168 RepID=A0ACC2ANQ0_DIPCM|nr:hypothetical protein O6H91_20G008100 [Diphasiastrum complanatum]